MSIEKGNIRFIGIPDALKNKAVDIQKIPSNGLSIDGFDGMIELSTGQGASIFPYFNNSNNQAVVVMGGALVTLPGVSPEG